MSLSDVDKAKIIEKDKKIKKLNRMILAKERELDKVELKSDFAKAQVAKGEISKEFEQFHANMKALKKGAKSDSSSDEDGD